MWVFREVIGALYAAFRQQTNNYITNSMSSGSEQPQSLNFALKAKYAGQMDFAKASGVVKGLLGG